MAEVSSLSSTVLPSILVSFATNAVGLLVGRHLVLEQLIFLVALGHVQLGLQIDQLGLAVLELELLVVGRHFGELVRLLGRRQVRLALFHARLGRVNLPRAPREAVLQIRVLPVNPVQRAQGFHQRGHAAIIRKIRAGKQARESGIMLHPNACVGWTFCRRFR